MNFPRRSLLAGLSLTLAAPAIVRTPGLLMPVRLMPNLHGLRITNLVPPPPDYGFVQTPNTMHITAHDLNQTWDTLNRRNGFAECMAVQWVSREELLQKYPMSQES